MNKFKKILLVLCMSLLLSSCAFTSKQDMTSINNLTNEMTLTYNRLALKLLSEGEFTDVERKQLRLIDRKVKFIITEFRLLKMQDNISSEDMYHLYKQVKVLYTDGRTLVNQKYDKLPEDIQLVLYKFDYKAINLDRKVESAADDAVKRVEALANVQTFMVSVLQIVIPLILV